ncbi:AAA family ATPase [Flavobacterium sp. UBA4197]|uniref:AAA family ATPase n=1 Tax=Flavobacterium sp. UBA4197 TaxID=1946546 RepID=UPI00257EAE57|nr:AAA family ATPase [Flavobacterium sp. UBA4197]
MDKVQYYGVGFTWKEAEIKNQLPRFIEEGIWENGFEDKYLERVNTVAVGSRIAAKTTYTKKENGEMISILEIHAIGTVLENLKNGRTLKVRWDQSIEPFIIKNKGAYRSTISRINNIGTIKAIFKNDKLSVKSGEFLFYLSGESEKEHYLYPCFILTKDKWNDFGYQTQYEVYYYDSLKERTYIGATKFLNKVKDNGELPNTFTSLDDHNICSLGQSNHYYLNLRESLNKEAAHYYLDAINDLAINKGLVESFEHEKGFKTSLIRSSEAQKALHEGYKIYNGLETDNTLCFTFSTQISGAIEKHAIKFDYSEKEDLPFRIKVLIGKNGTGKTQYIAKLASTLSGYEKQGNFSTQYLPPFSRVIAISYSLFDRFPRPKQTKTYSYYYCGFQSGRGFLTDNQVNARLKKALGILEKSERMHLFGKYIAIVLSDDIALDILDKDFIELNKNEFTLYSEGGYSKYSSGQIVMILMLAEVLAYITTESLLLFDEPETHLHPNSISLFVNVINRILKEYNSYAIISTHSPQIIQEVPAKDIIVIERLENIPSIRGLDIETFGENLNTITERIFHTNSHDEYYREFLTKLSKSNSYSKIIEMFEKESLPLSLSAKIYLQSLY